MGFIRYTAQTYSTALMFSGEQIFSTALMFSILFRYTVYRDTEQNFSR